MSAPYDGRALSIEPKDALWLLSSFCAIRRKSFDADALARECIPPLSVDDLSRIDKQLGLETTLVLQLMALAFPLFTQAIIDKVVVHRTEGTLIALAIGMPVFIV